MTATIPDETPAAPEPESPAPGSNASWWEDILDIFYAPSEVFARRRNAGFILPLLLLTALAVILVIVGRSVLQPAIEAETTRAMAAAARKNPELTPERMEQAVRVSVKLLPVYVAFGTFLVPMIVGFILWLATKAEDVRLQLGAACMIATYAYFPKLAEGVLNIAQGFILDPATLDSHYRLTLSLARFFDPDTTPPTIMALLGRIDLFTLWVTVLLAIGVSVVARVPRSKGAIAAGITFVVGTLPTLFQAIRSS